MREFLRPFLRQLALSYSANRRKNVTPATLDRPPPEAGEHTDEVLGELGYASDAIAALRTSGAVGARRLA
jgi:crotonobetainyl-CoA:carnitine CoA-transferase CaiB-like acyl-CoA transferase